MLVGGIAQVVNRRSHRQSVGKCEGVVSRRRRRMTRRVGMGWTLRDERGVGEFGIWSAMVG